MVENKAWREEQDKGGGHPDEVYDVAYFRTKFGIPTEEVMNAIKEAKTNNPVELEEYLARKYNLPEANPDEAAI
jgi:1-aminocyclopropane-1-carboxylate deaminase/D-cysteine desulfhydrase-like pyridoxal-dependent ACC family enzyme